MLKYNFDIDIHHYLEVDFESFREVVNAIGNVNVYFPYADARREDRARDPVRRRLLSARR